MVEAPANPATRARSSPATEPASSGAPASGSARSAAATIAAACASSSDRVQIAGTSYAPITRAVSSGSPSSSAARDRGQPMPTCSLEPPPPVTARFRSRPDRRLQPGARPTAQSRSYAAAVRRPHRPPASDAAAWLRMSVSNRLNAVPGSTAELSRPASRGHDAVRRAHRPADQSGTAPAPATATPPHATGARSHARPARPLPQPHSPRRQPRLRRALHRLQPQLSRAVSAPPAPSPRQRSRRTPDRATTPAPPTSSSSCRATLAPPPRTATRPRRPSATHTRALGHQQRGRRPRRPIRLQRPPQRRDKRPYGAQRTIRRIDPQVVHQTGRRYDAAPRDDQPRQHRPMPRPLQRHRPPGVVPGHHRPEHPELHPATVTLIQRSSGPATADGHEDQRIRLPARPRRRRTSHSTSRSAVPVRRSSCCTASRRRT